MKYFLSLFFLLFYFKNLSAQEKHFIFIQSDSSRPFYVSLNGKLYSSSAIGYLIIPKLLDGQYKFSVGFAQNQYPEQGFECTIDKKDLGFNLKNFNEKGWGLFNLQTLSVTMAGSSDQNAVAKALSENNVAKKEPEDIISFDKQKNDSINNKSIAEKTPENVSNSKSGEVTDSATEKITSAVTNVAPGKDTLNTTEPEKKIISTGAKDITLSKKLSEVKNVDGVYLSYVDSNGKNIDTIQVIIPSTTANANTSDAITATNLGNLPADSITTIEATNQTKATTDKSDVKFLDLDMNNSKKNKKQKKEVIEEPVISPTSNCLNIATQDDYLKLRKKMAMETTDEKMIGEAKKFYRNKCFTTSQIKGLSTLFLSDDGRLKFFDASFVSVADAAQYSSLQSEFIDPSFVNRFKTLLQ